MPDLPPALRRIVQEQAGALSRQQVLAAGVTDDWLEARVDSGLWVRWRKPGLYLTHSGPVPRLAELWLAVLACGTGAALSHRTAAELQGLLDGASAPVHVSVPAERKVAALDGVRVHRARGLASFVQPAQRPPRTRVERTVLDVVDAATDVREVVDVVTRACQRRRTTAERLRAAAAGRRRLAWRSVLGDLLADVDQGAESPLEVRYLRDVERAHGLPRGLRQSRSSDGSRRRDVLYDPWRLLVELDGHAYHPLEERHRDTDRDAYHLAVDGVLTLRFGWQAVLTRPCRTAGQVTAVLRRQGWTGVPQRCGGGCTVERSTW